MSGHGRFCVAAFLFASGAPAFSDPLIASVPTPAQRSAPCNPASRLRRATAGFTMWMATANVGSKPTGQIVR